MNQDTPQDALEDEIGQMLLFGWQADAQADALTAEFAVGGIILMGRNVGTPDETRAKIAGFQDRARARGLPPLFVATDQEGGRVQRLGPPRYPARPSAREIGQSDDPARARSEAASLGRELRDLGFNWDFAPVLDVDNNPANPVIGDRSYGPDPAHVAAFGAEAVRGLQEDAGILACGKHFPGHGDTGVDSHHALPRIPHDKARLAAVELVPFRAAVAAGLGAVMTSHILFPALDGVRPATLSPAILTGLLRQELGFDGLIITDDLEMRGVADGWGAGEAAVLAVQAGADIVLCCHTYETQRDIQSALVGAARAGRLTRSRIAESLARIARAKARWLTGRAGLPAEASGYTGASGTRGRPNPMNKTLKTLLWTGAGAAAVAAANNAVFGRAEALGNPLGGTARFWPGPYGDIFYTRQGDGPPVVLLHGLYAGASGFEWRKNFGPLAQDARVYAPDWLGFGLSDKPRLRYTDAQYIEQLEQFLREVVKEPCTLVASSLASAYAVQAARDLGQSVSSLVLVCPTGFRHLAKAPGARAGVTYALTHSPLLGTTIHNAVSSLPFLRWYLMNETYFDPSHVDDALLSYYSAATHQYGSQNAPPSFYAGLLNHDISEVFPNLTQKSIRLVWGREARLTPLSDAEAFLAANARAELTVFDKSGLLPHDEQAAAFNRLVSEHLAGLNLPNP